ncbi:hypothetical protein RJ55_04408 [Drechmeria coniospora]|nr:hypothetical protein RJ55_04408 [Drechmeria coniospora]
MPRPSSFRGQLACNATGPSLGGQQGRVPVEGGRLARRWTRVLSAWVTASSSRPASPASVRTSRERGDEKVRLLSARPLSWPTPPSSPRDGQLASARRPVAVKSWRTEEEVMKRPDSSPLALCRGRRRRRPAKNAPTTAAADAKGLWRAGGRWKSDEDAFRCRHGTWTGHMAGSDRGAANPCLATTSKQVHRVPPCRVHGTLSCTCALLAVYVPVIVHCSRRGRAVLRQLARTQYQVRKYLLAARPTTRTYRTMFGYDDAEEIKFRSTAVSMLLLTEYLDAT